MADVANGSYQLRAQARGYTAFVADQPVEVAGEPVAGFEVRLSAGAAVRGRLTCRPGAISRGWRSA